MRRHDFSLPWGREDMDDVCMHQIHKSGYQQHRSNIKAVRAVVDTSDPPSRMDAGDMFNSGKRVAMRKNQQHEIDKQNQAMVESMAETLRKGGPTMNPTFKSRPYQPKVASNALNRRREFAKIEAENKRIAERLRNNVKPIINTKKHLEDYGKAASIMDSISNASRRKQRITKANARGSRGGGASGGFGSPSDSSFGEAFTYGSGGNSEGLGYDEASGNYGGGGGGGGGFEGSGVLAGGSLTGLSSVVTARDVRHRVAAARGEDLPDWLLSDRSSMPAKHIAKAAGTTNAGGTPGAGGSGSGLEKQSGAAELARARRKGAGGGPQAKPRPNSHLLVMTHNGAGPAPVLQMPAFPM